MSDERAGPLPTDLPAIKSVGDGRFYVHTDPRGNPSLRNEFNRALERIKRTEDDDE